MLAVAQAFGSVAARAENGQVLAWGCDHGGDSGQCRVPVSARSGVTAIAAGTVHSLALQGRRVMSWGCGGLNGRLNSNGQCRVPVSARSGVKAIAAGPSQSLALKQDGRVIAWGCGGASDAGQCRVPASARSGVIAIAAGSWHSLALKSGR